MTVKKPEEISLNSEQREVASNIWQPGSISVLIGEPGTGKTLVALQVGFKLLKEKKIKRIVLTRPVVEAGGRSLGFLPGDLSDKYEVYLAPFMDFCTMLGNSGKHTYTDMVKDGQIAAIPIAFMRGMTFDSSDLVIVDEAQNTNEDEMKMILTRMAGNSRLVVTGDLEQSDLRSREKSGLKRLVKAAELTSLIYTKELTINERNPHMKELLLAWSQGE